MLKACFCYIICHISPEESVTKIIGNTYYFTKDALFVIKNSMTPILIKGE